ncbi:MAG: Gfo/Idh/MocA family oxidoreductase [Bryobacterales bacterium]
MKIGVVGLGFMGATHLEAWSKVPGFELGAVSSHDDKKLAGDLTGTAGNLDRGGQQMDFSGAAKYHTAEELFADPNIEAVDLCTPSYLHASQAIAALEAGKHVLVEKPMALTGEECDRMLEAAQKSGKVLMVAQVLRFWPDYSVARDLIQSGALGPVKHAFFYRKCAAPGWSKWMHEKSRSGGGAFDLLIHDFDYCRYLFGKPAAVRAVGVEEMEKGIDTVEARLDYGDGPLVTIAGGWRHPKAYPFSMEFTIVCEEGTLDFNSALRPLTLYKADGTSEKPAKPDTDGFVAQLTAYLQACRTGEAPDACRPEESADSVRMALAMGESRDKSGEAVNL